MENWFQTLVHSDYAIPLIGITVGGIVIVVVTLSKTYRRLRQAEMDAALKHKMLDQGMSADDIKKVLESSAGTACGTRVVIK